MRKKANRPAGRSTRATSAIAPSTSSMCSNTRQATTPSNEPSGNGNRGGIGTGVLRTAATRDGDVDLVAGRVDPDDACTVPGQRTG